ncbi:hypothetical protein AOLI_G00031260 [Acnodon oligacanthus]
MPKIQPQIKVLIIKTLKIKSAAEVADIFNVSKRQVERIRKRLQDGNVHDNPMSGKPLKATAHSLQKGWKVEKWQKVDFSDESSIELHPNRRKYCTRPVGTRRDPRFTQKAVKFGGGKIMVWGYIQYGGARELCRVDGNISSLKYQDILAAHYIPNYKTGQILQQDGAPSHTSPSTSKFLQAKKIKVLQDWPAQSPDMNIIEHVWGKLKEEAWKMKPKKLDELWESCKTAFFAILDDFINKLFESLPRRMDAVLQAHGSHT